tara:strand:+ start:550 stop:960 length:411 start_codon:yes stop_codon:yes gene_type:complete
MQLDFFEDETKIDTFDGVNDFILCPKCHQKKPPSEYYLYDYKQQNGAHRKCKPCYNQYIRETYQLKKENPYPYRKPNCACCGLLATKEVLALDHDHETKKFRGYLCRSCNTGIGSLGDNIKGLESALLYLKRHYDE